MFQNMEFPWVLNKYHAEFPWGEALFCLEFSGSTVRQPKSSRVFIKKSVLNPSSCLFVFFCNSPILTTMHKFLQKPVVLLIGISNSRYCLN